MLIMKYVLLLFIMSLMSSCEAGGIDFKDMEASEKAFNERQKKNLIIYMSLENLFPDPAARSLAKAAGNGDINEVNKLVNEGIAVDIEGTKRATPLFYAIRSDNIEGFRKLLELGANPNAVYEVEVALMHLAVQSNNDEFLKAALEYKGDPNLVAGSLGYTPLFRAIGSDGEKDILAIKTLMEYGADLDIKSVKGNTAAITAAGVGRFDIVYELLTNGADYSIKNDAGYGLVDRVNKKKNGFIKGSEQERWLEKVTALLRSKGVDF